MPFLTFVAGPRAPLAPSCPTGPAGALYHGSPAGGAAVWLSGVQFSAFAEVNVHGGLGGWTDVGAPSGAADWPGTGEGTSASDLWHLNTGSGTASQISHWDGSAWTLSTGIGLPVGYVGGISNITTPHAVSSSEAYVAVTGGLDSLVNLYTWDGSAWTPEQYGVGIANPDIQAVTGSGGISGSLWGMGRQKKSGGARNGNAWILALGTGSDYYQGSGTPSGAVHAGYSAASNDVWGAGWLTDNSADTGFQASLWHWNGSAWSVVTPPWPYSSGSGGQSELFGVHGTGASDIWAVGYWIDPAAVQRTLIYHYDGSAWTRVVPDPDFRTQGGYAPYLYGVYATATDDAWAVGEACHQQLAYHWDGTVWTAQPISY